ncbi:MAG: hypothetical protein ACOX9B_03430 [Candidatus Xenobium sp.]|nr:hypothetical protein [Burkholderiales bacterium]
MKRASCRILKAFLLALGLLSLANLLLEPRAPRRDPLPMPLRRGMPHAPNPSVGLPGVPLTRSGQPVVPEPEEGVLRVLVLGGSSPFGYGTTRFRSYPGILQARLDDAGRPVEVVHGAFAAMDLLDSLEVLRQALPEMRPGLVVCALGINETMRLRLYSSENPHWSPQVESWRQFLERFALYRFLAAQVAAPPRPSSAPPILESRVKPLGPEHIDLVRPILRQNLGELVRLCRQAGIPLVLLIDPSNEMWPPFVAPDWSRGSPWLRAWEAYESGVRLLQEGRREQALASLQRAVELDPRPFRTLPSIAALIREFGQEVGVPVMEGMENLRRASPSGLADENLFYDNCHLSPPGNQAFAGLLEAFLDQEGLLPPPARGYAPPAGDPADLERVDLLDEDMVLPPTPQNLLTPAPDWKSERFPWTHAQFRRRMPPETTLEGQVARGHLAFNQMSAERAVAWYRKACQEEAGRAVLWRNLGHALLASKQGPEAIQAYVQFLRQGGRDHRLERLVRFVEARSDRAGEANRGSSSR